MDWSHFGVIMNNIAGNSCAHIFEWMYILIFPGYISRSKTAGLHDNCIFDILKNCQTIFQSDIPMSDPQESVFFLFLMLSV